MMLNVCGVKFLAADFIILNIVLVSCFHVCTTFNK